MENDAKKLYQSFKNKMQSSNILNIVATFNKFLPKILNKIADIGSKSNILSCLNIMPYG